tara:strand:+ start:283 stop:849 length:567 start_codon:yes stop_codon:yes gene_type:complete
MEIKKILLKNNYMDASNSVDNIIINNENNNLNTIFNLYFHDPNSYNWEKESYKKLCKISTIHEYWILNHLLSQKIHLGMFFLMRNEIFPLWDNEDNKNGCSFSFKILKKESIIYWNKICILILSENFLKKEHMLLWNKINGLSISPKKNFCIIKIWLKEKNIFNENNIYEYFNIPKEYSGDIIFKDHM